MNGIIFFFCEILCLFVNLVPIASFCYKRKSSKMAGGYKGGHGGGRASKIPISQLFSKLGKIKKFNPGLLSKDPIFQFSIFIINWIKLEQSS